LAAILNAVLLLAAVTHVRRIAVSYPNFDSSIRYSSVTTVCIGLQSLWDFPPLEVGRWPSDRRYGRSTPATARILVFQEVDYIHVHVRPG